MDKTTPSHNYGRCAACDLPLSAMSRIVPVFEKTWDGRMYKTDREQSVVDYLFCERCGDQILVDGTFDYEL